MLRWHHQRLFNISPNKQAKHSLNWCLELEATRNYPVTTHVIKLNVRQDLARNSPVASPPTIKHQADNALHWRRHMIARSQHTSSHWGLFKTSHTIARWHNQQLLSTSPNKKTRTNLKPSSLHPNPLTLNPEPVSSITIDLIPKHPGSAH